MVKILKCDLLESDAKYICHQVNCKGVMGSGVAKAIADKWPIVKEHYVELCKGFSESELIGTTQVREVAPNKYVINIFGQTDYGRTQKLYTSYDALASAFEEMRTYVNGSIAFPYRFGCGLANGDWATVDQLIVNHLGDFDVRICLKE